MPAQVAGVVAAHVSVYAELRISSGMVVPMPVPMRASPAFTVPVIPMPMPPATGAVAVA